MSMPSSRDRDHIFPGAQSAVCQDQKDVVLIRGKLEGDFGILSRLFGPSVREQLWRLAGSYSTDHPFSVSVLGVFRRWRFVVFSEVTVMEYEFDSPTNVEVHLTEGEPASSFFRVGEIVPEAFDGTGKQTFEAHGSGSGDGRIVVRRFLGWAGLWILIHFLLRGLREVEPSVSDPIQSGDDVDTAPRTLGSLRFGYNVPRWQTELEWVHNGGYYLDAANDHEYGGHNLLNLRAVWRVREAWSLALRLNNLTDKWYADRADFAFGEYRYFPGRGRELFFQVAYQTP